MPTILRRLSTVVAAALTLALVTNAPVRAANETRLKDIMVLQGYSAAPLIGYGLVVGLNKTGDRRQTIFSTQSLANMLSQFGVLVDAGEIKIENVAAVLVTAELSPYQKFGARLDVIASSIGDAKSLQGGTLLPTSMRGPMGEVAALAQGPLSIGGFGGGGGAGSSVQVNHLTVGRIPGGAIVQTSPQFTLPNSGFLSFSIKEPDNVTASRVAAEINGFLGNDSARAVDAGSVEVQIPDRFLGEPTELLAQLEALSIETDVAARVVINERTGTVVIGGEVQLGPAAVAHGNLSVRVSTQYEVSQPSPFSGGETVVVPNQQVQIEEGTAQLVELPAGATLSAVTTALNALGASPRDIIAIVQALKAAGALKADIIIQ